MLWKYCGWSKKSRMLPLTSKTKLHAAPLAQYWLIFVKRLMQGKKIHGKSTEVCGFWRSSTSWQIRWYTARANDDTGTLCCHCPASGLSWDFQKITGHFHFVILEMPLFLCTLMYNRYIRMHSRYPIYIQSIYPHAQSLFNLHTELIDALYTCAIQNS